MRCKVVGINVALRAREFDEHAGMPRHHEHAGRGGREHEATHASARLECQLLRHRPTPGDAEHVDLATVAERIEQSSGENRILPGPVRKQGRPGTADARRVKGDHLDVGQAVRNRREKLEVRANAIEKQQRRAALAARPHADANTVAEQRHVPQKRRPAARQRCGARGAVTRARARRAPAPAPGGRAIRHGAARRLRDPSARAATRTSVPTTSLRARVRRRATRRASSAASRS